MRDIGLREHMTQLDDIIELGTGRLPPDLLASAVDLRDRARERMELSREHVVAALCGGTGTGKSSLFNALAGRELAPVAATRPATDEPRAWVPGGDGEADALLDWLEVVHRHRLDGGSDGGQPGLVLLDLPDHDSIATSHREAVDRLAARVDVLVWIVDRLKYAQGLLHDSYLHRLVEHADVVLVVLNRTDELSTTDQEVVLADLRRLLDTEGLTGAPIVATSAVTGEGIDELAAHLDKQVRGRRALADRLAADIRLLAGEVADVTSTAGELRVSAGSLVDELEEQAGLPTVVEEARESYRAHGRGAASSTLVRAGAGARRLVGSPVRAAGQMLGLSGRHATPAPSVAGGSVRRVVTRALDHATDGGGTDHVRRLRAIAAERSDETARAMTQAREAMPIRPGRRWWWPALALLATVAELIAVAGLVWLIADGVVAWLQLPPLPMPVAAGEVPWPTALLLGGAASRLVLLVVTRVAVATGANRHGHRVGRALREALENAVDVRLLDPLREEATAQARLAQISRAAAAGHPAP